ncbi:RagB/SusD family nutrient uptake outer membrane protein [Pedobacter ginsengisoli]|uniref:RagB/SusD family nutrient uptake outer membrane protein n=1 Tax=Pedobacter ginsengisoli TaxID=363852 RepID=UPI00254B5615|nr:RagB/SusD family nutrient uptake outer membrane protein [Pedobacter ginsengisoli]
MNLKNIILLLVLVIAFSSCKKFLDIDPLDKLTPEQAFSTENNLQLYVNSFYGSLPDGPGIYQADVMTDITVPNAVPNYISGKLSVQDAAVWSFSALRNINYFLENYNNNPSIPAKARNHFAGIARFFRAYFYFQQVKQYGDMPWYSKTLGINDPGLYKAQDPRALVMDSVLADIDFAINNVYATKDNSATQVTKWVALALKSRICLFEGTFRKYHKIANGNPEKWLTESASAAELLISSGQYKLQASTDATRDYRSLFTSENPVSSEVLLAAVYNNSLKKWHNAAWWFNSATLGARLGLDKKFINTYLKADGSRFTDEASYATMEFQNEVKNRDRRLQQTIRMGDYKRTDGTPAPPDFTVTYSGYQIQKYSLDDKYFDTRTESFNSIPIMRYAEVLLNYAEAKAELGMINQADWSLTIGALRKRAGIANFDAMPASADTYLQNTFYPDVTNALILEVRRERGIELAVEGFRYDDLKRWKAAKNLEKPYTGIYIPGKDQLLDLNEDGKPDVSFVDKVPAVKVAGVTYFVIDNNTSKLSEGTKGNLLWLSTTVKKYEDKQYLYPINANERLLNPNLNQNPGWEP